MGKLYGTANGGGSSNMGTLFSITTSGTFTALVNFSGANGSLPNSPLKQNTNGILYGDTYYVGGNVSSLFPTMDAARVLQPQHWREAVLSPCSPPRGKSGSQIAIFRSRDFQCIVGGEVQWRAGDQRSREWEQPFWLRLCARRRFRWKCNGNDRIDHADHYREICRA